MKPKKLVPNIFPHELSVSFLCFFGGMRKRTTQRRAGSGNVVKTSPTTLVEETIVAIPFLYPSGHFPHFWTEGGPICSKVCHGTEGGPTVDVATHNCPRLLSRMHADRMCSDAFTRISNMNLWEGTGADIFIQFGYPD